MGWGPVEGHVVDSTTRKTTRKRPPRRTPAIEGPLPVPVGARFGPWLLEKALGKGPRAVVYRARSKKHEAAVKIPLPGCALHDQTRPAALEHPGILCGSPRTEPQPHRVRAVLRYNLTEHLRQHRNGLPEGEVLDVLEPLLEALDLAHRNGVVHGNLKPSNLLCDKAGRWKLVDFAGPVAATGPYAAPEQATPGAAVDARTDLYAVGKLLFLMLTGQIPTEIKPLGAVRPQAHWLWAKLLDRLLEPEPFRRPATAANVRTSLRTIRDELRHGRVEVELGPSGRGLAVSTSEEERKHGERFHRWVKLCTLPAILFVVGVVMGWHPLTALGGLSIVISGIYTLYQ